MHLTPGQNPPHEIDIAADSPGALEMNAADQMHYKQLVAETGALFGSRHYRDYHFLLTLSDDVAHFGLEHHESSDDRSGGADVAGRCAAALFSGSAAARICAFVERKISPAGWTGYIRLPATDEG